MTAECHNLDTTDGQTSFATARVPAWHRLGTVFDRPMTVAEALDAAHLAGWDIRKMPIYTDVPVLGDTGVSTVRVEDDRSVLTIRTNPINGLPESLGPVGKGYHHVQNEDHVAFLEALLDMSGAGFIETAGALDGGRRVFATAKLPEAMLIGGRDAIDLYVAVMNAHDGSRAFMGMVTPIRVVCRNTEAAAIGSARQMWTRRHTSGITGAVEEARATMAMSWKFMKAFEVEAERMIQTELTAARFEEIVAGFFPAPEKETDRSRRTRIEKIETIHGLWDAPTQDGIRGTNWGGYNTLTEWSDHYAKVQQTDEDAKLAVRALNSVSPAYLNVKATYFEAFRVPAPVGA